MYTPLSAASLFLAALLSFVPVATQAQGLPSIRRVQVLRSGGQVEIEIETSEHIVPQTNLLSGPDRLVVDFVNARPGAQLRNLAVNRGEVKNLRVGLFSSDPPVTRVVLDLDGPQPYQIFPSGKTVIVKIGEHSVTELAARRPAAGPELVNANYPLPVAEVSAPRPPDVNPRLNVSFRNGLLSISSNKANLSEILFAIHERTGADIAIPAGAEQEQVAGDFGPAPAPEVLAHLLNGSKFNFMILSSSTDPQALDRVILSPRGEGSMPVPIPQAQPVADESEAAPGGGQPLIPVATAPPTDGPPPPPETAPDGNVPN